MLLTAGEKRGVVLGDRVNLRNAPGLESEVVGAANYGDTLRVLAEEGEWIRVGPAEAFDVWVFGNLLFEEREVRAPQVNLRAGPGTQFPRIGQLTRGEPVEVLESRGDWRRIRPSDAVTLYIHKDFLQLPGAPSEAEPLPTPSPTPEPVTVVEIRTVERIVEVPVLPTPTPTVVPPAGMNLVPLQGQGTPSVRQGYLKAYLLAGSNPSRFVLVRREPGGAEIPLAYLRGDEDRLRDAAGNSVLIRGRDFWVTGSRVPVTDVESLEARPEAP